MQTPNACLIIIGNEILSGRTQDKNLAWLAQRLNEAGVRLMEVRVIPDIEETIIDTVNACRRLFGYVFTTGGIGPTHDDITSESIAKAFGLPFEQHPEAAAILQKHYADQINEARMSMADMPRGARLIYNPVSAAPGFVVENVYVLAGVPSIMQAMFSSIRHELKGGETMLSRTLAAFVTEGALAAGLTEIQERFPTSEIGSYPFFRAGKLGTSLVARNTDPAALRETHEAIRALLLTFTDEIYDE